MSTLKALKDIPTLAYLYRTRAIHQSSKSDLPNPNQQINNKICTIQYDITKLEVDAIVNAANSRLMGGGGVDGAIHRAAGRGLIEECSKLGGCKTGSAKITGAYRLPCKHVIHAVGPVFDDDATSEPLLRGCYRSSLQLAVQNECKSIAFSALSTGIYGYPSRAAAQAALREVSDFLNGSEGDHLDKVIFCSFLGKDVQAYAEALPEIFPPTPEDLAEQSESSPIQVVAQGDPFMDSQTRPRVNPDRPDAETVTTASQPTDSPPETDQRPIAISTDQNLTSSVSTNAYKSCTETQAQPEYIEVKSGKEPQEQSKAATAGGHDKETGSLEEEDGEDEIESDASSSVVFITSREASPLP